MGTQNGEDSYLTTPCCESGTAYASAAYGLYTYYFLILGLSNEFEGEDPSLEEVFAFIAPDYPYEGDNAPEEFDGNPKEPFYLNY